MRSIFLIFLVLILSGCGSEKPGLYRMSAGSGSAGLTGNQKHPKFSSLSLQEKITEKYNRLQVVCDYKIIHRRPHLNYPKRTEGKKVVWDLLNDFNSTFHGRHFSLDFSDTKLSVEFNFQIKMKNKHTISQVLPMGISNFYYLDNTAYLEGNLTTKRSEILEPGQKSNHERFLEITMFETFPISLIDTHMVSGKSPDTFENDVTLDCGLESEIRPPYRDERRVKNGTINRL